MDKRPYQKLLAWQVADDLCVQIYRIVKNFPKDERFGLTSQTCRSAYSVPMNIAEGNAKRFPKDKARFFEIALSSLEELHYQIHLAQRLEYIEKDEFITLNKQIGRTSYLLTKLRSSFLISR